MQVHLAQGLRSRKRLGMHYESSARRSARGDYTLPAQADNCKVEVGRRGMYNSPLSVVSKKAIWAGLLP